MAYKTTDAFAAQFFDDNGAPAENHTLTFLVTGTSTPATIAFDTAGSSTATSVTIGANGFPQNSGSDVEIYFDEAVTYDIVRKDSGGTAYGPTVTAFSVTPTSTGSTALGVLSAAGSAANAITADLAAPPSSLTDQTQVIVELQHAANTSASCTFNLNSLGDKTIKRDNNAAIEIGDTGGIGYKIYLSYSATNDVWILLNPSNVKSATAGGGLSYTAGVMAIGVDDTTVEINSDVLRIKDKGVTKAKRSWLPFHTKEGLEVTNNSGTPDEIIDISAGEMMDTTDVYLMELGSAFTKTIASTFAVGTGLGGLSDDDSLSANTWYGVFLLSKSTDPTDSDVIIATTKAKSLTDAVATAAGFDISRLIGYVLTDATSDIIPFLGDGHNAYLWDVVKDETITDTITRVALTLQVPPFQVGRVTYYIRDQNTQQFGILTQIGQTDTAPTNTAFTVATGATDNTVGVASLEIKTDGSSQIYHRESAATTDEITFFTRGYKIDYNITDLV